MCKASPPKIGEGVFKPLHKIWPLEGLNSFLVPQHRKYRQEGRYFRPALIPSVNGSSQARSIPHDRKYRGGVRYFRWPGSSGSTSG